MYCTQVLGPEKMKNAEKGSIEIKDVKNLKEV